MAYRLNSVLAVSLLGIAVSGQSLDPFKTIVDENQSLSILSEKEKLAKLRVFQQRLKSDSSQLTVFKFVDAAYRLCASDTLLGKQLKTEAYGLTKKLPRRNRYCTGDMVGLAVQLRLEGSHEDDAKWLMDSFPDQHFFILRYLECASSAPSARKNASKLLTISGKLVASQPTVSRYAVNDAFLHDFFAEDQQELSFAIEKYRRGLGLSLSAADKAFVARKLEAATRALPKLRRKKPTE